MTQLIKHSVLFVCFGNICRSPMAEAVFIKMLEERSQEKKWDVDSAAVSPWYIGSSPDKRAVHVLQSRGYTHINQHKARQVKDDDFHQFEYILAMDDENLSDLNRMAPPSSKAKLELLGTYDPAGEAFIDDPFWTKGDKIFYKILDLCKRSCEGFFMMVVSKD